MNEARCGPDMPNNPGLAERAILLLPDRELCPDNTGLYISMSFGVVKYCCLSSLVDLLNLAQFQKFFLGGGRRNNRLDAVQDEREGVVLLTRTDLDQGEGHRQGQGSSTPSSPSASKDQDLVIQELIEGEFFARSSQLRYERFEDSDRREGPGYQVVRSLQTLPPGRIHTKEHHEGSGELQENSPRALSVSLILQRTTELPM
ncbi:hypothetical protein CEXT_312031 [Caerostris extrusa]|uniref:Uncharacterized protein n=1 Tax=Caerostris extrusa TaxID=172846 RepID=A0AAV4RIF7_CAEEX|nr:hypothetical protein CEXT_312031 [Caerostris extrusa]